MKRQPRVISRQLAKWHNRRLVFFIIFPNLSRLSLSKAAFPLPNSFF
ncbi:hypothetical protein D1AOALGA4SA_10722 [Olavius algarvensis Delta 1 endosymbiont]|nr:hypothetical protein D1AOALGA4SA_10722 [Olavius algarvensis Delta 1 endosymbiont]